MEESPTIRACHVTVDFTKLVRHEECTGENLREMAWRAREEVGRSQMAEVAKSLLDKLEQTLTGLAPGERQSHVVGVRVKMHFDRLARPSIVVAYVTQLELLLNRLVRRTFLREPESLRVEFSFIVEPNASSGGFVN